MDLSTNAPENQGVITRDAADHFGVPIEDVEVCYEDGEWWVYVLDECANYGSLAYIATANNNEIAYEDA